MRHQRATYTINYLQNQRCLLLDSTKMWTNPRRDMLCSSIFKRCFEFSFKGAAEDFLRKQGAFMAYTFQPITIRNGLSDLAVGDLHVCLYGARPGMQEGDMLQLREGNIEIYHSLHTNGQPRKIAMLATNELK